MDYLPARCEPTTLERALALREQGFIFEEKRDGIRAILQSQPGQNIVTGTRLRAYGKPAELTQLHAAYIRVAEFPRGCVFDGELMPDGSYVVFDLLVCGGVDLRRRPLADRKVALSGVVLPEFVSINPYFESIAELGEFGEGVVIKDIRSRYGFGWWKAKRIETDDVLVESVDYEKASAAVFPSGRVSGVPGCVRPGDTIEVEFFKRFESGRLRNGRFLRVRDDKNVCRTEDQRQRVSASC